MEGNIKQVHQNKRKKERKRKRVVRKGRKEEEEKGTGGKNYFARRIKGKYEGGGEVGPVKF